MPPNISMKDLLATAAWRSEPYECPSCDNPALRYNPINQQDREIFELYECGECKLEFKVIYKVEKLTLINPEAFLD